MLNKENTAKKKELKQNSQKVISELDDVLKKVISEWYEEEWQIPTEKTLTLLQKIANDTEQLHVVLTVDDKPVATAGLHTSVGLIAYYPELKVIENWLALVYTVPSERKKGYASILCQHLEAVAKQKGFPILHLFTHSAEHLYRSLNWTTIKYLNQGNKKIALMQKQLTAINQFETTRRG